MPLLPASEKRVAAHEECVGRFAKKSSCEGPSISRLVLASSPSTRDPIAQAAACTSLAVVSVVAGLAGLTSTATRVAQLVLAVFGVENTEHGSPPLANTRSGPLEHDINASREPRTD